MTKQTSRPGLVKHSAVLGTYSAVLGLLTAIGRARGVRLPERFSVQDTILLGTATHKASRILTKQEVTGPLRAPFTSREEATGASEVNESARGEGVQHTVGELLTCPFCVGVWMASGLTAGMVMAPRVTRLATTALTAIATSDMLQFVYDGAKQRAHQGPAD
jgi:hypothetical protein